MSDTPRDDENADNAGHAPVSEPVQAGAAPGADLDTGSADAGPDSVDAGDTVQAPRETASDEAAGEPHEDSAATSAEDESGAVTDDDVIEPDDGRQERQPSRDGLALEPILEGAIIAADGPLPIDGMISLFGEDPPPRIEIRAALERIAANCDGRGFELKEVASGFRFQVRQEYGDWISRLWTEKAPRYTRALLETLALIAYKQPITRGDIEEIRGVAVSTNIIRSLLEREWIRVVGHRDVPGRPAIYATTRTFLDYFNLRSLDELPSLSEIRDLDEVNEQLDLTEDIAPARTLELAEAVDEEVADSDDASLDEVTDKVNAIQENIRALFREDDEDDPVLEDDLEAGTGDAAAASDTAEIDAGAATTADGEAPTDDRSAEAQAAGDTDTELEGAQSLAGDVEGAPIDAEGSDAADAAEPPDDDRTR